LDIDIVFVLCLLLRKEKEEERILKAVGARNEANGGSYAKAKARQGKAIWRASGTCTWLM
jgi:hypothetical protein